VDYIASAKEDESPKKRPDIVGIRGFSEGVEDQPEIDSPMRRKKKGGLDSLKISQEPCEAPAPEKNKFENLEKKFELVLTNYESKKLEFDDLKKQHKSVLHKMKTSGKLQQLRTDWQKSLEMQLSENEEGLVEFN